MKTPTTGSSLRSATVGNNVAPHSSGAAAACYGHRQTCGLFWKTQLCSKWKATGKCPKKEQCSFAHSLAELRDLPDLRCTKWCRRVFRGLPCEDLECPYAHSREQLRCNSHQLLAFKTALCKFYAKGMCLSGEACRFAHTLKELRSPDAATICVVNAGDGNSRQVHHTRQTTGRQNRPNSKTPAKRSGGESSRVCNRKQKTACHHGNYRGCANSSKGNTDSTNGLLSFSGARAKDNKTDEREITASTAHEQKGQQSSEHEQDSGDAQGISTCEATETLLGITSSSTSRASSRSSSKSFGASAAEKEPQFPRLRPGDALGFSGIRRGAHCSKEGTATHCVPKSVHKRNLRRLLDGETDVKVQEGNLVAACPQGRPCISKLEDSKGAKGALNAGVGAGFSPVSSSLSHSVSVSVPASTSAIAVTAVPPFCHIYTKTQLLAVGASFKRSQHHAVRFYHAGAIPDDKIRVKDDLTFRVVSCDENTRGRVATEITHSFDAQLQVPGGPTEGAVDSRRQPTWPGSSKVSEMTASRTADQQYKPCSPQSSCVATRVAAPPVPFSKVVRPCLPEQVSSRSSSPGTVPLLGFQRRMAAQKTNTRKSRGTPNPAVCSATRIPYNIHRELRTATRRTANSSNIPLPTYPVSVHGSTPVPPPPLDNCRADPPPRRAPTAAFLLYTQALEAAVIAAATCYRSLEEMETDGEAGFATNMGTRGKREAEVHSFSCVDTWGLHAKSMALVTLAALCRLALLPPQQPQFFEQHTPPSSLSALATQQPLELATIMEHLAALTSQPSVSQHLHDDDIFPADAGRAAKVDYCDAEAVGESFVQPDCEDGRPTSQSEIHHCERSADQQRQPFLVPEVRASAETARTEQQCANSCGTDNLNTRDSTYRGCPRCLFLAALREHQLLFQHTNISPRPLNPLDTFFQRIAPRCRSNAASTSDTDNFRSSASGEEEEKQQQPPPELVASLLRYVQVASDLQQARAF